MRVGINGMGRIGRLAFRAAFGAARIILTPFRGTESGTKCQPANAAHAIDANLHARAPAIGLPKASTRACNAMRSSVVKGRLVKISNRRRSAA